MKDNSYFFAALQILAQSAILAVFYLLDWTVLFYLQTVCVIVPVVTLLLNVWVKYYNPTIWVRHQTGGAVITKILKEGFNGQTFERANPEHGYIAGQRGRDYCSFSTYRYTPFERMVSAYHKDVQDLYVKVPVCKTEYVQAIVNGFIAVGHGKAIEINAERAVVNKAIAEGNFSTEQPNGWYTVKSVLVWLAGHCQQISYNEWRAHRNDNHVII